MMADTGSSGTTPKFEEALAELEGIVKRLEQGELPLEDSLAAFERGIGLVRALSQRLAEVEQRVEVLLKSEGGKLLLRPAGTDDDE
jgi:exodeoxyribonuclease VII small subunit